jgi:protein SCO1/2
VSVRAIVGALLVSLLLLGCRPSAELPRIAQAPAFSLLDQDGRQIDRKTFAGKVWIANFIFTHCPDVCPIHTGMLSAVRTELLPIRADVRFASFSVDPEHDTPAVLKKYAIEHNADQPDWRFLTGPLDHLKQVVVQGFKQAIDPQDSQPGKAYTILHGSHFVLVDRDLMIRGYYRSDAEGILLLQRDVRILVAQKTVSKAKP